MVAALAVSPPRNCVMSDGSTGTMIPTASMSSTTVTKMKRKAADTNRVLGFFEGPLDVVANRAQRALGSPHVGDARIVARRRLADALQRRLAQLTLGHRKRRRRNRRHRFGVDHRSPQHCDGLGDDIREAMRDRIVSG